MSQWNTTGRRDPATVECMQQWVRRYSPLVGLFADTKVGKTTWLAKLFGRAPIVDVDGKSKLVTSTTFAPTLFIDADAGAAALGDIIEEASRVDYRKFDAHPDQIQKWALQQLVDAEKADCQAIVFEGVNAIYELALASAAMRNPSATSFEHAREASPVLRTLFAAMKRLKLARISVNRGIPIFVTLNVKGKQEGSGATATTVLIPNMSDNLRRRFIESADAILELTRVGDNTTLLGYDANPSPRHSIRGPSGPACPNLGRLIAETNLDPIGLMALWADHSTKSMPKKPTIPVPTEPVTNANPET
jgi:hypothetical protein